MTELIYPEMPEHSLVVLIGPSGAGKSTIARTWPASQVLSLDALAPGGRCVTLTWLIWTAKRDGGVSRAGRPGSSTVPPGGLTNYASPELLGSISAESVWSVMRTGVKVVASTGDSPVPELRA